MDTSVFDVVHMFSERSISAVPIIDEEGVVVNMYETVDVIVRPDPSLLFPYSSDRQTLVRLGAYQNLDFKIREALTQRSPDFPGVVICTASDSLGTLLQLIKKRRVHRLVVVEGEVMYPFPFNFFPLFISELGGRETRRKEGPLIRYYNIE